MFGPLFGVVRADLDRQIGWAKQEVRRQTRYTALMAIFAGVAALAAVGAAVVGLIALYTWLATQKGPFVAYAMIGGGLLLIALILFSLAFVRRRPRPASRPPLQIVRPAALFGTNGSYAVVAGGEPSPRLAKGWGSRSTLLGTVALFAVAGLIAGRRL